MVETLNFGQIIPTNQELGSNLSAVNLKALTTDILAYDWKKRS